MTLRIALFGQAPLATDCLDRLLADGHQLVGVFAPPDAGRPDALAARAAELGLPLFQRRYFQKKSGEPIASALESYRSLGAELNVMASQTSFLPRAISDAPRHMSLCFHPSLLPRFRGGNAMHWQIIRGESKSGVSVFVPDEGVDTGPLVVQKGGVAIAPDETTGSLFFKKLCPLGVEALVEAVRLVDSGQAKPAAQDESRATAQGLVDDTLAALDLSRPAGELDRLARACDPQPGAYLKSGARAVRLFDARLEPGDAGAPGTIVSVDERGLALALRGGVLRVGRVRADAGKEPAQDFAARTGLAAGARLESG